MNISEEADRLFELWIKGRHAAVVRILNMHKKSVGLAVIVQLTLRFMDHDEMSGSGVSSELPSFIEALEREV